MSSFDPLPKTFVPVYLVGMMGSGKSTVGPILASMLQTSFIDTDMIIEQENGPIHKIFVELGEDVFRGKEDDVLRRIVPQSSVVVATGGGMPVSRENLSLMLESGIVVYLKCSIDTLELRLQQDTNARPLLDGAIRQNLSRLMALREDAYVKAQIVVNGNLDSPGEIAASIVEELKKSVLIK